MDSWLELYINKDQKCNNIGCSKCYPKENKDLPEEPPNNMRKIELPDCCYVCKHRSKYVKGILKCLHPSNLEIPEVTPDVTCDLFEHM